MAGRRLPGDDGRGPDANRLRARPSNLAVRAGRQQPGATVAHRPAAGRHHLLELGLQRLSVSLPGDRPGAGGNHRGGRATRGVVAMAGGLAVGALLCDGRRRDWRGGHVSLSPANSEVATAHRRRLPGRALAADLDPRRDGGGWLARPVGGPFQPRAAGQLPGFAAAVSAGNWRAAMVERDCRAFAGNQHSRHRRRRGLRCLPAGVDDRLPGPSHPRSELHARQPGRAPYGAARGNPRRGAGALLAGLLQPGLDPGPPHAAA